MGSIKLVYADSLESGFDINETFPKQEPQIELDAVFPASIKSDFDKAYIYVADLEKTSKIESNQKEVTFTSYISAGKYDMEAQLIDEVGRVYPAYYVYIEKI